MLQSLFATSIPVGTTTTIPLNYLSSTMKVALYSSIVFLCSSAAQAWTMPCVKDVQAWAVAAGVAAAVCVSPPAAHAEFDPTTYSHQYADPKHPNCKRIVIVREDGTAALSGTDGTPGCPADGSGNVWRLVGEVEGNKLVVDFSPKGGPPNLKGTWDGDGIKWPDGNKWTVTK